MTKITAKDKEDIKLKLISGVKRREICEEYGINESHLSRLARDWGLQKKDIKGELIDTGKATKEIEKAATQELLQENKKRLELILQTGKFCIDEFGPGAKSHGYDSINDFLVMAVEFWLMNHQELEELRDDLALSNSIVTFMMVQLDPELARIKRNKTISDLAMLQLLQTGNIQDNLLEEYLNG